jgi:hypothetical protein
VLIQHLGIENNWHTKKQCDKTAAIPPYQSIQVTVTKNIPTCLDIFSFKINLDSVLKQV